MATKVFCDRCGVEMKIAAVRRYVVEATEVLMAGQRAGTWSKRLDDVCERCASDMFSPLPQDAKEIK